MPCPGLYAPLLGPGIAACAVLPLATHHAAAAATAGASGRERPRTPAWTDRILYRAANPDTLHKILYTSHPLYLSDHIPVVGCFLLNAAVVDTFAVAAEIEAAQRALDATANNAQPRVAVHDAVHDVGTVRYGEVATRTCTIENVGAVRLPAPAACAAPHARLIWRMRLRCSLV